MMKWIVGLCFVIGLLIGWCLSGPSAQSFDRGGAHGSSASKNVVSLLNEYAASEPSLRLTQEHVEISQERLTALLDMSGSTALSDRAFVHQEKNHQHASLDRLAQWCGLNNEEKQRLAKIVLEAAESKKQWEMANVKVASTSPGHWTLDFPGDDGMARARLKQSITAAFSPEKATAIDAGGDLNNFFGFGTFVPEFKNGRVEISAKRLGEKNQPDPAGSHLEIECQIDDKNLSISLEISPLQPNIEAVVFAQLLGWGELPGKAAAAAEEKVGK